MTTSEVIEQIRRIKFTLSCDCKTDCMTTFEFTHLEQRALAEVIMFYINENGNDDPDNTGSWIDQATDAERNL